jgi:excisionase family DNA binding protein
MTDQLQMLTPKEVAEILGVHQKTVHIWLRTGKLEGSKLSYRAWRIPIAALNSFIERNRNVPKQIQPDATKGIGMESSTTPCPEPVTDINPVKDATPQAKMKHYIRDIMGEQSQNHSK